MAARLAIGQGAYYALTALWALVHVRSFQAITGPKTDLWLVKTPRDLRDPSGNTRSTGRSGAVDGLGSCSVVYMCAMVARHFLIAMLVTLMVGLAPLAQASPPDQTWLGGLYDDADYDNVVLSVTSAVGAVESQIAHATGFFQTVAERPIQFDESAPSASVLPPNFSRAPPAA